MPETELSLSGYDVESAMTFCLATFSLASLILFIHQRRNLLRHQPNQKYNHRGAKQQHAHIGEAAFGDEGVGVVT